MEISFGLNDEVQKRIGAQDMPNWSDNAIVRLEAKTQEQVRANALQLHKSQVMNDKSGSFFADLAEAARQSINAMKIRVPTANIFFERKNTREFKVGSTSQYPSIAVDVALLTQEIRFVYTRLKNAESVSERKFHTIDFGVDESNNLCLSCRGNAIAGIDAALSVILDPVLGLADI